MTKLIVNVLMNSLHPTKIAANWRQLIYFIICLKSNMTVYSGNWRAELGSKKNLGGAQDPAQRQMLATNHEHYPGFTLYKKTIISEPKEKRKAEY